MMGWGGGGPGSGLSAWSQRWPGRASEVPKILPKLSVWEEAWTDPRAVVCGVLRPWWFRWRAARWRGCGRRGSQPTSYDARDSPSTCSRKVSQWAPPAAGAGC
jgi:hypothetical protein